MAEYLLFFGENGSGERTIWVSDGTTGGTNAINDSVLVNGTAGSGDALGAPGPLLFYGYDKIYTQAGQQPNNNEQLLVWDTHGESDPGDWTSGVINPYGGTSFLPQGFAAYDGLVYFNGQSQAITNELYSTDGGSVTQITRSALNPSSLAVAFGRLFFSGNNGSDNVLYAYDRSGELNQVPDPNNPNNPLVYNPAYLTTWPIGTYVELIRPIGELVQLFMSGQDSPDATTTWLYRYDGTNLHKIAPASAPAATGLRPYDLCGLNWLTGRRLGGMPGIETLSHFAVCFSGLHHSGGRGLWISGGTSETTTQIDFGLPIRHRRLVPVQSHRFQRHALFHGPRQEHKPQFPHIWIRRVRPSRLRPAEWRHSRGHQQRYGRPHLQPQFRGP
ncbi:hypothetical protein [Mycobacterium terramassiliense]|uniref:Mycobacterium terramassiliense ORFan n=1 Tax=Mycobacterium terramassiliense TaxID=1841859 RepID=A0A2U3ND16_9MYCO|nr:hypothetical protein [Mycobacterium terramassiliense]SPM29379.1 Mycobacterium terramassiliense ORFan [Mycobacterium terramassiliense]